MKNKCLAVGRALLWCLLMLLFPVGSGTLSVILNLDTVQTLVLQGICMMLALIPPGICLLRGKTDWQGLGFGPIDRKQMKKVYWFLPVLLIFVPVAMGGFTVRSMAVMLGNLFLYIFVGLTEEIYFRAIIPGCLEKQFITNGVVILSSFIFALGHLTTAFTTNDRTQVLLTVFNAFIFGWMAMEMTLLCHNILPAVCIHFIFDFETKIAVLAGNEMTIAECIRGMLMCAMVIWLADVIKKESEERKKTDADSKNAE